MLAVIQNYILYICPAFSLQSYPESLKINCLRSISLMRKQIGWMHNFRDTRQPNDLVILKCFLALCTFGLCQNGISEKCDKGIKPLNMSG